MCLTVLGCLGLLQSTATYYYWVENLDVCVSTGTNVAEFHGLGAHTVQWMSKLTVQASFPLF